MVDEQTPPGFEELLEYLKQSRGFDFTGYKRASLLRRVDKRMRGLEIQSYDDYLDFLQLHPHEFETLFNSILINVTSFFRDVSTWTFLRDEVLPRQLERLGSERPIRAWVAGCASGEEAYTLAIVLAELLGHEAFIRRVKIYGTDVDEDALTTARAATYTAQQVSAVPEDLRDRYFEMAGDRCAFRSELRRCVVFGRLDLVHDAPISRLELLTCRNTLMYFGIDTQAHIIERFNFALNDSGILVLGKAETLLSRSELFEAIDRKRRIFSKVPSARRAEGFPTPFPTHADSELRSSAYAAAFAELPAPAVIFNQQGVLLDANVPARERLGIGDRDIGAVLQDLDLSYRPVDLRTPVTQALREGRANRLLNIQWSTDGGPTTYDVHVLPLHNAKTLGVLVVFDDHTRERDLEERLELANIELEQAYREVQSTNEEIETMNEELQSTIEELETTNEELQSTNEELETMNEELQSTNDELHAVNDELRARGDEVDQLNHFLQAVFESFGGGVAVVDEHRRVRVWNHRAEDLWGAREDEVAATDLMTVDIGLPWPELAEQVDDCLARGGPSRSTTVDAVTRRGRSVKCRVTMTPLYTDGTVEGAILVMEVLDSEPAT